MQPSIEKYLAVIMAFLFFHYQFSTPQEPSLSLHSPKIQHCRQTIHAYLHLLLPRRQNGTVHLSGQVSLTTTN
jgi:hypothetical protein